MNRIISVLLIFSLAISLVVIPTTAESSDSLYYIEVIKAFELMDSENDTDFFGNEFIDRETAVRYVLNLMNIRSYPENKPSVFLDVSKYSEAYPQISAAVSAGIIKGDSSGNFRPKDNTTYTEAYTMILRALGYEMMVQSEYQSYDYLALTTGLTNGITPEGIYITRYDFAKALYNSFEIGIVEPTVFGTEDKFTINSEKSSLSFHNIRKETGVITANETSSVYYTDSPAFRGRVIIDNTVYDAGITNAGDYLGYNVEFYYEYYENNDEIRKLKYVIPRGNKTESYNLDYDYTSDAYGKLYYTDENGKEHTINTDKSAIMILNGEAVKFNSSYITKPDSTGEFIIITHPGSGKYNVIIINSLTNDVIQQIDVKNKVIYLKKTRVNNKPYIELPDDNIQQRVIIKRNGKTASFEELMPGDVISYSVNSDGSIITIYASDKRITGVINSVEISDETIVEIDGTEYKFAEGAITSGSLKVSLNAIAYLSYNGRIVYITTQNIKNYAYVLKCGIAGSFEKTGTAKLLLANGTVQKYNFAEKITINNGTYIVNGNKYIDHSVMITQINNNSGNLIVYRLNSKNEIENIDFPGQPGVSLWADRDRFVMNHTKPAEEQKEFSGKTIDGIIAENSIIFEVPQGSDISEEDCRVSVGTLVRSTKYKNLMKFYDIGTDGEAKAILCLAPVDKKYTKEPITAVTVSKITNAMDNNGDYCKKLYFYTPEGIEKSVFADVNVDWVKLDSISGRNPEVKFEDLKPGDIIAYETDFSGKLKRFTLIYSHLLQSNSTGTIHRSGGGSENNREFFVLKGTAIDMTDKRLVLEFNNGTKTAYEPFDIAADSLICVVNTSKGTIRFEPLNIIYTTNYEGGQPGDTVMVMANRNVFGGAWIYE